MMRSRGFAKEYGVLIEDGPLAARGGLPGAREGLAVGGSRGLGRRLRASVSGQQKHQHGRGVIMYNYILVPLDGSERAEAILPHVEELGKRYDAQVIFLRVVEPVSVYVGPEVTSVLVQQADIDRLT